MDVVEKSLKHQDFELDCLQKVDEKYYEIEEVKGVGNYLFNSIRKK